VTTAHTDALADLLVSGADRPLTAGERAALTGALGELVESQRTIDTLTRALASHEEDAGTIERLARSATAGARAHAASGSPMEGYDAGAARRAREELLSGARDATDARAIVSLALRFVRTVMSAVS